MRSRRPRLAELALAAASALAALLAAEALLRLGPPRSAFLERGSDAWFQEKFRQRADEARRLGSAFLDTESDPRLGWRVKPLLRLDTLNTNSRGLRGIREYPYVRRPGVGRILVLGDSFTFGLGVRDEEVFAARMEDLLGDHEVLNFGVNGYGPDQQLLYFRHEGTRYRPDVVLLAFYYDDFHRTVQAFRELPKPRFDLRLGRLVLRDSLLPSEAHLLSRDLPPARRRPLMAEAVAFAWRRARRLIGRGPEEAAFAEKADLTGAILAELARECERSGARLAIVYIPLGERESEEEARVRGVVADAGRATGVPVLALAGDLGLGEAERGGKRVYDANDHWSPLGHGVAAGRIVDFLTAEGLIGEPARDEG